MHNLRGEINEIQSTLQISANSKERQGKMCLVLMHSVSKIKFKILTNSQEEANMASLKEWSL
jgi:hypothetical protein